MPLRHNPGTAAAGYGTAMQELKRILAQEQTHFNSTLFRHAETLPAGVRPAAEHVLSAGGKRLRPLLTLLTGRALGCGDETLYTLGAAVEMLHAATLLHDDIMDNADTRRDRPSAHTIYPPSTVILAGDAMLAKAMLMVSSFEIPRLTNCISEAVMHTAEGQIAEFGHLRDLTLSHNDYLKIITGKSAWLLRASCELAAAFAGAEEPLIDAAARFGLELGIAFQMVDDALDFAPDTGKPRGGDLREGKVTPPLLLYAASLPPEEAAAFRRRFADNSFTPDELENAVQAVFDHGHCRAAREIADVHLASAARALEMFPPSEERDALAQMTVYVRDRSR